MPDVEVWAYPGWDEAIRAFREFIRYGPGESWDGEAVEAVLFLIACDHDSELLTDEVADSPSLLLFLARRALLNEDRACRWQLAAALGRLNEQSAAAESLLVAFARDSDEYVRRRAILALGQLQSSQLETVAASAWSTDDEYHRVAVLWALHTGNSSQLPRFLAWAQLDQRPTLIRNAVEIEALRSHQTPGQPKTDGKADLT